MGILTQQDHNRFIHEKFNNRGWGTFTQANLTIKNFNSISIKTADNIRFHTIKMIYNALTTHRRFSMIWNPQNAITTATNIPSVKLCTFCNNYEETIEHIYGGFKKRTACDITKNIRFHVSNVFDPQLKNLNFLGHILGIDITTETTKIILAYNYALWKSRRKILNSGKLVITTTSTTTTTTTTTTSKTTTITLKTLTLFTKQI